MMKKIRIAVFDSKPYVEEFLKEFNRSYAYDLEFFANRLTSATANLAKGFNVVCAFINDDLGAVTIDLLKSFGVELIALRSAGYNNVDLKAAFGKIHIVRVPAYSPYAVAEHAVALMMTLNRKTHRAYCRTRENNFQIHGLMGFDMYQKIAGVIGLGKIGKCLVSILRGFGMEVLAYDMKPDELYAKETGIRFVALNELLSKSDIISLHCPLTPATKHMINVDAFSVMKKGVMLINTGRGKLIDTKALIGALKSGKVGSAGLDVYEEEEEYFFEDFSNSVMDDDTLARLLTFPNVLVTSHQAFFTKEAMTNITQTTFENVKEYFAGEFLKNEICYKCDQPCRKKDGKRCF